MNSIHCLFRLVLCCVAVATTALSSAYGHPVAQGSVEIRIQPETIATLFRISNEQVFVAESIGPNARPANSLEELWERHADYVRSHVTVLVDGTPRPGKVVGITSPTDRSVQGFTEYLLEYAGAEFTRLEVRQDLLQEIEYAPGNRWEATFAVRVVRGGQVIREASVLAPKQPLIMDLGSVTSSFETAAAPRLTPLAWDYFIYGLRHIAGGWDHVLFVVALVIAVPRLWPVLALVTVFTLAHTITLTLAVLRIVSAPGSVVEPIIAASIVIAAALNLFRTNRPPLGPRLMVAFGFGLFHGLGFASGLIAAMDGFRAAALAAAITGFSLGVEAGHQLVVIPLVAILWILNRHATRFVPAITRIATIVVLLAGIWLLSHTLHWRSTSAQGIMLRD